MRAIHGLTQKYISGLRQIVSAQIYPRYVMLSLMKCTNNLGRLCNGSPAWLLTVSGTLVNMQGVFTLMSDVLWPTGLTSFCFIHSTSALSRLTFELHVKCERSCMIMWYGYIWQRENSYRCTWGYSNEALPCWVIFTCLYSDLFFSLGATEERGCLGETESWLVEASGGFTEIFGQWNFSLPWTNLLLKAHKSLGYRSWN